MQEATGLDSICSLLSFAVVVFLMQEPCRLHVLLSRCVDSGQPAHGLRRVVFPVEPPQLLKVKEGHTWVMEEGQEEWGLQGGLVHLGVVTEHKGRQPFVPAQRLFVVQYGREVSDNHSVVAVFICKSTSQRRLW